MPVAVSSLRDTPRNGHRPRNFTSTKLFTSTVLTRISASSAISDFYPMLRVTVHVLIINHRGTQRTRRKDYYWFRGLCELDALCPPLWLSKGCFVGIPRRASAQRNKAWVPMGLDLAGTDQEGIRQPQRKDRIGFHDCFSLRVLCVPSWLRKGYFTLIPGWAPESGSRMNSSLPPGPAASTMPSETPKRILRGARLATITVSRPSRSCGA